MNMMTRYFLLAAVLAFVCQAAAHADADLLLNQGFETPELKDAVETGVVPSDWMVYSSVTTGAKIGLSTTVHHAGKQSVRLAVQGVGDAYQGLLESVSVTPGTSYHFTVYVRNDDSRPLKGSARGQISIEWKDKDGREIDRRWGPDWGVALPTGEWTKFEMTEKAPPNAVRGNFVINQFDGHDSASGVFFADDASVTVAP
jgi:hypothetical protein